MKYSEGKYDPIALNAISFDSRTASLRKIPQSLRTHGMWYYYLRVLYAIIKQLAKLFVRFPLRQWFVGWGYYKSFYDGRIVFVLPSLNNLRALGNVVYIVKEKKSNVMVLHGGDFYRSLPQIFVFWKSLENVSLLLQRIVSLSPVERRIVGHYISQFFYATGYTLCYKELLTRYRPECVIFSNDHLCYCKTLALLCEDYGIKSVYVQHASVSYAFPELHFTLSFLDGLDALDKYTSEGKRLCGEVFLLGAVRYDVLSAYRVNRNNKVHRCIGIAINIVDDNCILNEFCNDLLNRYKDLSIRIRSHPSMKSSRFCFDNKDRIIFTCATDESIIDFLDCIDLLIAGDSGVHLDALLGGVPSVAYNFSRTPFDDFYRYVERGLIKKVNSIDNIYNIIDNKSLRMPDETIIRLYDESYGKKYAGKCAEIVADYIINDCDFSILMKKYNLKKGELNCNQFWSINK